MMSSCDFLMALLIRSFGRWRFCPGKAQRRCPMRILDVLDMTGSTARRFDSCRAFILIENLSVVTTSAGGAREIAIEVPAHVALLMTTTA